nr:SDR family NAD(P)-dependent oxidoreductase [Treponema sp.]
MEMHEIAALLRGLALEAVGERKGAVVASEALGVATSGMPGIVDLGADLDEGAILAALRATMAGAGAKLAAGEAFAIPVRLGGRHSDRPSARLFSIGTDVDSARSLLGGSTSPKSEMGRSGSIAAARGAAPIAAPGAAPDAVPDAARIAALGAAPGSASGRDAVVAGKVALVTGGAQGFGEEITRALVASGALVWIADINVAGAARLAAELNGVAGRTAALPLGMDVTDEASVAKGFEEIAFGTGALDLVVSNAGVLKAASIFDQDLGVFDFVTKVNYTGFFLVARASARMLRLQRLGAPLHGAD